MQKLYKYLWMALCLLGAGTLHAQITNLPKCRSYGNKNLRVESVALTAATTTVFLSFTNNSNSEVKISLDPYTLIKEKDSPNSYTMMRVEGIGVKPEAVAVKQKERRVFSIVFPAISAGCYQFDLIECAQADCFNVSGIAVDNALVETSQGSHDKKFQREYGFVAIYSTQTKAWGDWIKGNYLFVFNINDKNDFRLYLGDGNTMEFSVLSNPKNTTDSQGNGFQYMDIQEIKKRNKGVLKLYDTGETTIVFSTGEAYQFYSE